MCAPVEAHWTPVNWPGTVLRQARRLPHYLGQARLIGNAGSLEADVYDLDGPARIRVAIKALVTPVEFTRVLSRERHRHFVGLPNVPHIDELPQDLARATKPLLTEFALGAANQRGELISQFNAGEAVARREETG